MRVIAGGFGGRNLVAPAGTATRPTSDRVREALFSILGDVAGCKVLDLYAGTGALGFEALSRGAVHVTFVERAAPALRALRQNLATLGIQDDIEILTIPVERALTRLPWPPEAFDLVLIDPPYAEVRAPGLHRLSKAFNQGLAPSVKAEGRVVLEHASADDGPEIAGITRRETRVYGDTALSFYVR